ncbi:MAG TPA: hypothetical protein VIC57_13150 [Candidatus Dormibacteraeota bacterium]|jgi:hypothetical protein
MRAASAGQTLVIFALVLAFFFVGMLALVADVGALFVAYNRVDDGVLLAVQAGASAIDEGSFYTGSLQLDAAAARARCQDTLAAAHLDGRCAADARSVTADVRQVVALPVPLLGVQAPVHVARTAQPAFGGGSAVRTT